MSMQMKRKRDLSPNSKMHKHQRRTMLSGTLPERLAQANRDKVTKYAQEQRYPAEPFISSDTTGDMYCGQKQWEEAPPGPDATDGPPPHDDKDPKDGEDILSGPNKNFPRPYIPGPGVLPHISELQALGAWLVEWKPRFDFDEEWSDCVREVAIKFWAAGFPKSKMNEDELLQAMLDDIGTNNNDVPKFLKTVEKIHMHVDVTILSELDKKTMARARKLYNEWRDMKNKED